MDFLIFTVAFCASVLSGIGGGGANFLYAPFLLALGLEPFSVLAAGKAGGSGLGVGATVRFRKSGHIDYKWVWLLLPISLISGIVGPALALLVDAETVKLIVSIATIAMAIVFLLKKTIGITSFEPSRKQVITGYSLYSAVNITQGAFGAGIGSLKMFIYTHFLGFTMLRATATQRLVGLATTVTGFVVFAINGVVDWKLSFITVAGMVLGGYVGAHLGIKKGNTFVKNVFILLAIAASLRVLYQQLL